MKSREQIEQDNLFADSIKRAKKRLNICAYPDCTVDATNTHILQRNGILTPLVEENHVIQPEIDHYGGKLNVFARIGYKTAFSFPCFCNEHDSLLFKPIESYPIDFTVYKNRLLFLVRAKYNELYRKKVVTDQSVEFIEHFDSKGDNESAVQFSMKKEGGELGVADIERDKAILWNDYFDGSESFIIETRDIDYLPICLASYFDYETSIEIERHRISTGKHMEELSSIFISVFPYEGKSKLIMAYLKKNESKVKAYVNAFIKESEKKLQRRLTNLLSFYCETWITSESFYNNRIKACEGFFEYAVGFSYSNLNERRNLNINLFSSRFCEQATALMKKETNS